MTKSVISEDWLKKSNAERSSKESFNAPVGACNFYDNIMTKLKHVIPGRTFSRDEMNDREFRRR
tara:strand:- start:99 stop:290 length:192 start_codon:yes stop_codon:yes gene_type:complete